MRLRPGSRAGDPNAHRFRGERTHGLRGIYRCFFSRLAGRVYTTGQNVAESSGGSGGGSHFIGSLGNTDYQTIINIGNPLTGALTMIWGYFSWDSSLQVWGA